MTSAFSRLVAALALAVAVMAYATPAEATSFTVANTYNWTGTSYGGGAVDGQSFTTANPPSWTHTLSFAPPAASFTSVTLDLRHMGNRASSLATPPGTNEIWLLFNGGAVQIGTLADSGNSSSGNAFIIQTFNIPSSLFPILPANGWTLQLRLQDNGTQTPNTISLDYATLSVTYDDGVTQTAAVPEPGSLLLLGGGLLALGIAARRRRKRS